MQITVRAWRKSENGWHWLKSVSELRRSGAHRTIQAIRAGNSRMTVHFRNQDDLELAMRTLVAQDGRLMPVLEASGMPALRQRAPGFAGLASVICGQQLSTFAAAAIW